MLLSVSNKFFLLFGMIQIDDFFQMDGSADLTSNSFGEIPDLYA